MGKVPVSKIAELRQKAGLTQQALALKVDVTETTIRNYEKGRSILEWIERVIRLCDALDCQPSDLIDYVEAETVGDDS
ncbi:helix-turn-helix transcriptional regulator [Candidatus Gracilibacteria bacterium]|nr:helix-turn-helix transcriptional regulator [Candidatus Gracilibacteria bacterium]NJM90400.1 helix-turn-helix transcriptional regulator [Hydrococcus sp. RU_2_2]